MIVAPPSDNLDRPDRVDSVDADELEGVDAARSSCGTASRASEGDTLGEGEHGRCSGEATLLAAGLDVDSAILA